MVAAATIGSAVIGAAASSDASRRAGNSADAAQAAQAAASAAELNFQKAQYDDWKAIYGPAQQQLADFYNGLDSETLIASGLKDYELQYQEQNKQMQRSLAQRGLDSPVQESFQRQTGLNVAEQKAQLRTNAPLQVARAKQNFVAGNVSNPNINGIAGVMARQTNYHATTADRYRSQQATADQATGQAISDGVTNYLTYS